jgi:hypothetical protein
MEEPRVITNNRFAQETALFEAMLPELMVTDRQKWFVAWDGQPKGIFETYDEASNFMANVPRETDVLVREITDQEVRLPLYFVTS